MVLSLTSPVGTDFIKNWVGQNTVNCDAIDSFAGPYTIQSYTPTLTASTTNPTLGTGGVITGNYYRIFDQIVAWGEFRFKTGFNAGSGLYEISMPFDIKSLITIGTPISGDTQLIGNGRIWINASGASRAPVTCQVRSSNKIFFNLKMENGTGARVVSGVSPGTWAIDDGMNWVVRYQRVP